MTVYVDDMNAQFGRMKMCHMLADTDDELHAMADKIGVARRWHQKSGTPHSHYDVCLSKRAAAVKLGAVEVDRYGVAEVIRRKREATASKEQPQGPSAEDVRELSKWLNEEVSAPINRQALARVLAVQQPQGQAVSDERVEELAAQFDISVSAVRAILSLRDKSVVKESLTTERVPLSGWQPIETAPKDGTKMILWWDSRVLEGWCAGAGKSHDGGDWWRSHSLQTCLGRPTHWQPLPPPPNGITAKERGNGN